MSLLGRILGVAMQGDPPTHRPPPPKAQRKIDHVVINGTPVPLCIDCGEPVIPAHLVGNCNKPTARIVCYPCLSLREVKPPVINIEELISWVLRHPEYSSLGTKQIIDIYLALTPAERLL